MNYQTVLQNYLPVEQGDFMLKYEIDDRGYAIYSPDETYIIQKGRLSLNLRPPYSEARKQKAAKQIQKVWKEMKGIP